MTADAASLPVIRALLDEARKKNYDSGVLGVRARPQWDGPTEFDHHGVPVRVVPCPSALAVREALLERSAGRWLVVLTDRDEQDLGLGITAHLAFRWLRRPDPWDAVRERFEATRIDHRLVTAGQGRELATGLLAATPTEGWPPARGGLLTRDHAFGSVAAARLRLGAPGRDLDLPAVLAWTVRPESATALADLRALSGDTLVDAMLNWVADACGTVGQAVQPLLRDGRAGDVVPLGLVAQVVLTTPGDSGPRALLRREVGTTLPEAAVRAWASAAEDTTRTLIRAEDATAAAMLARAETQLAELEAGGYAGASDVLRRGLTARLAELGEALRVAAQGAPVQMQAHGPDAPLVDATALSRVEKAWGPVEAHALAEHTDETRVRRALAGVRLARWLAAAATTATGGDLAAQVIRYRDEDAWVDRAVGDAWSGVTDEQLAQGLRAVLTATRLRRDLHDRAFAEALAAQIRDGRPAPAGIAHLESVVASTLLPLARTTPVLLVVADGMSVAMASEVVDDVVRRYETWLECVPDTQDRRGVALALLPTVTEVSRTSLLCGELAVGDQARERDGFTRLCSAYGLRAALFHKKPLEASEAGFALAHDVAAAVDDTAGMPVVACVLNTIDDALERSDPGGTDWTADTVKHLHPLLDRARRAGRVVVLTSDHGHVVERREGRMVSMPGRSSNRSRPSAPPPGDGEVRVHGPRVLLHDGDAVLAVDERLRYGPVKAGYHGGAAPAEVVVPVVVLAPGHAPDGWRLAPPQAPFWWRVPSVTAAPVAPPRRAAAPDGTLDPFGEAPETRAPAAGADLAAAVLGTAAYRDQRRRGGRVPLSDDQVARLLRALLSAPAGRLDPESAAAALGVATVQLAGALSQAQRLLNVEQYPVLSRDPDGSTVVLDEALLREQFGVGR